MILLQTEKVLSQLQVRLQNLFDHVYREDQTVCGRGMGVQGGRGLGVR